jgi:hypothetical protein
LTQIKDIKNEISEAESALSVFPKEKDLLNEEGLPIKDIREDVFDEQEGSRAVLAEKQPAKMYTMEEIDRMMDEAMEEEHAELEFKTKETENKTPEEHDKLEKEDTPAIAPDGLSVGTVDGEELLARIVDDTKNRYNPVDGTWVEDEDDDDGYVDETDEDDYDEDDEEEEDQYGRTRGFLIPPNLSKPIPEEKGVKFAAFEKPATPSSTSTGAPVKSALKKTTASASTPQASSLNPSAPISSSHMPSVMATTIVEREPKQDVPTLSKTDLRIPRICIPKQLAR